MRNPQRDGHARLSAIKKSRGSKDSKAASIAGFPIVGIGASAGGFESLMNVFKMLPPGIGMAFIIVQHLDPKHPSRLSELMKSATTMSVQAITDRIRVRPDHVYVIPPNYDVILTRGVILRLKPRPPAERVHMAIDHFFESLAQEQKSAAIGVLLSGTGTDGTLGLGAIKAAAGLTFAEAEKSAKYFAMPGSAIAAGFVDAVVTPRMLAARLSGLSGHPYLRRKTTPEKPEPLFESSSNEMNKLFFLLRQSSGVNFKQYKQTTVERRIARRMVLHQIDSLSDYVERLRNHPNELEGLFEDLLINVTSFFRDRGAFHALKGTVLKKILKAKPAQGGEIRIWIPGCASGQEVYSVAIALMEAIGGRRSMKVQVFGTDLSEKIIAKARLGIYPESIAQEVSAQRLRLFFNKVSGGYQIQRSIRDICTFARQNVCEDPPFSHLDLVSCRNMLIYLDHVLQKKCMEVFHYALNPGGFLILGNSETIGRHGGLFGQVDKRHKIYVKKSISPPPSIHFGPERSPHEIEPAKPPLADARARDINLELQRQADWIVLSHFSPGGVIVNPAMEVLQFRGRTGIFFEHAPGEATLNLLRMVRPSLMIDTRIALQQAIHENRPVSRKSALLKEDGVSVPIKIDVHPFTTEPGGDRWCLVLFEEFRESALVYSAEASLEDLRPPKRGEIRKLREEIKATHESLQAIIAEREAANEELRSANEETQSSNEELQSTNEELETAKEELQSTNEELTTVNEELATRNAELGQVNDDLHNLLSSINIPIVIVDNNLAVRRVTPLAKAFFNLLPGDVGRQLSDIKPNGELPNLNGLIREVIVSRSEQEMEVKDGGNCWYSLRIRPYRTSDDKINGAVITLVNINKAKGAGDTQKRAKQKTQVRMGGRKGKRGKV